MGARQSKRSVDITTGKEVVVEGSEVAAGAGGEGKLERIEDIDTLKPQLNGDAHQDEQISDKEKKMQEQDDAQENEKDNSNEKDIIITPVTVNGGGEGEAKEGENTPEPETNKKPKKEKVKKKWSFRSISFSKKDKQKPAKKEETNGECDKVPEEVGDGAVIEEAVAVKSEVVSSEKEVAKNEDSEKTNDKEPETPVTEPLTNGSSAPETPKEEVRQNGDSPSVDEQPSPVETTPEVVKAVEIPEADEKMDIAENSEKVEEPKLEEKVVPEVESLPMNGLKIDEPVAEEAKVDEVPQPEVQKIEEVVSETVAEPIEEKCAVVADAEVCVEKEKSEAVGSPEVAPPPLPTSPPPSSLTMFAESTMAPLVDTQNVENNVDASINSLSPLIPAANIVDDVKSAQSDSVAPSVCEINPVTNIPAVIPNEIENNQVPFVSSEVLQIESSDISLTAETNTPLESSTTTVKDDKSVDEKCVVPLSVENIAVVSSSEIVNPQSPVNPEPCIEVLSSVENVSENVILSEKEIDSALDNSELKVEISDQSPIESDIPVENVQNLEHVEPLSEKDDSPILRASSDPDVSETNAEPQSDSFPPPPPPESCPESMTELSASESLPPPMSEFSVPDAILNSPTSETAELPGKDDAPLKNDQIPVIEESETSTKIEEQALEAPLPELNGLPPAESPQVVSSPTTEPDVQQLDQPSKDTPQVKTVSDVVAEVPAIASEVVATESTPSGDSVAE